jgi:hypothetical protein
LARYIRGGGYLRATERPNKPKEKKIETQKSGLFTV